MVVCGSSSTQFIVPRTMYHVELIIKRNWNLKITMVKILKNTPFFYKWPTNVLKYLHTIDWKNKKEIKTLLTWYNFSVTLCCESSAPKLGVCLIAFDKFSKPFFDLRSRSISCLIKCNNLISAYKLGTLKLQASMNNRYITCFRLSLFIAKVMCSQ